MLTDNQKMRRIYLLIIGVTLIIWTVLRGLLLFFPIGFDTLISIGLTLVIVYSLVNVLLNSPIQGIWMVVKPFQGVLLLNQWKNSKDKGVKFVLCEGGHPKFPWETPEMGFTMLVQKVTSGDPETVEEQAEFYPTKDGTLLKVTWIATYKVDASSQESLLAYAGNDIGIVPNLLGETVGSWISSKFQEKETKDLHQHAMNPAIKRDFQNKKEYKEFQKKYGIIVISVRISNIQYDEQSQRIRNQRLVGQRLKEFIKSVKGILEPSLATEFFMAETEVARVNILRLSGDVKGLENLTSIGVGGLGTNLANKISGPGKPARAEKKGDK